MIQHQRRFDRRKVERVSRSFALLEQQHDKSTGLGLGLLVAKGRVSGDGLGSQHPGPAPGNEYLSSYL